MINKRGLSWLHTLPAPSESPASCSGNFFEPSILRGGRRRRRCINGVSSSGGVALLLKKLKCKVIPGPSLTHGR